MDKSLAVLSEITIFQKYARFQESLGRRETWSEIVERWTKMMVSRFPSLENRIKDVAQRFIMPKLVMPSMRALQFAGKAIDRNEARLFNCSYQPVDSPEVFSETMFLLLSGSGVGYSVQTQHVAKLPPVLGPRNYVKYLVQDSIEGWSDAVKVLVESYFYSKPRPVFDFSDIRPAGAKLKISGGKAPGHKQLAKALAAVERILKKATGRWLRPIEVHDILCHLAVAVLSGGIRRSAMIAFFSPDDKAMAECKSGEWWVKNPQRGKANNSMVFLRSELTREAFDVWWSTVKASRSGEPGLCLTNDLNSLYNPCHEASLRPRSFCNLTEINSSAAKDQFELNDMAGAAAFIGTLQTSFTNFHYLRPEWRETTQEDALLGVSATGLAGIHNDLDLSEAAHVAVSVNAETAKLIGVNPAKRVTCGKPSGTTSLVMGTSSGVHPWHAPFYIRRLRMNKLEPLYDYLSKTMPELVEDSVYDSTDAILSLPIRAPEGCSFRDEPAVIFLERVKKVYETWIKPGHRDGANTHNVSATVSVGDDEWDEVCDWLWNNKESYAGISILPRDCGTYKQLPFEEISEDRFVEMEMLVRGINLTEVNEKMDDTNLNDQVACSGGLCLT